HRILDEGNLNAIISWGIDGTSFVVHDMNQFTTSILPKHFKHSNFASFVRQLNKYDFHKVKSTDDAPSPYGENVWQFRHPEFRANHGDNLDLIKRKPPSSKKAAAAKAQAEAAAAAATSGYPVLGQLDNLARTQAAMQQHMSNLSADYQAVIGEMINFQRNMVAQDQLMQNMIQYLVSLEAGHPYDPAPPLPPPQQQQQPQQQPPPPPPPPSSSSSSLGQPKGGSASRADPNSSQPPGQSRPPPQQQVPPPPPSIGRRESAVPGWAVPPRVLLVEDDTVCRKLSSKFLEKFGCQIDVAVDGVSAVNKMNAQKYDLVLMVSVLCVSATSLIRQFDPMTPIISMTSNSGPNDIMTYFSHGMNDVLPKPFTKENLLSMLEKHLDHLK
ncbi:hypothetical protein RHOSPDRAFT_7347, partial [Rhodotorula sp. JG-1b]